MKQKRKKPQQFNEFRLWRLVNSSRLDLNGTGTCQEIDAPETHPLFPVRS